MGQLLLHRIASKASDQYHSRSAKRTKRQRFLDSAWVWLLMFLGASCWIFFVPNTASHDSPTTTTLSAVSWLGDWKAYTHPRTARTLLNRTETLYLTRHSSSRQTNDAPYTTSSVELGRSTIDTISATTKSISVKEPTSKTLPVNGTSDVNASDDYYYYGDDDDSLVSENATAFPLSRDNITCGCPMTCDDVALSRVNRKQVTCRSTIYKIAKQLYQAQQRQQSSSETELPLLSLLDIEREACRTAHEDPKYQGVCGLECHPTHCHNVTALQQVPLPLNWSQLPTPTISFRRYDKVVVATKVLGPTQLGLVQQMVCLLTAAYNHQVNYDIIVFTTLPWKELHIQQLQQVIPNIQLKVVVEGLPLDQRIAALTDQQRQFLFQRCNVQPNETITWDHRCTDGPSKAYESNLGYAWQSEFRSYHIWSMDVLKPYKYMLWMDADALCTQPWTHDPVKLMVEHHLVLAFDNFPQGKIDNPLLLDKLRRAYHNRTLCYLKLHDNGQSFVPIDDCSDRWKKNSTNRLNIPVVHGFHHITDLDFYRHPSNLNFLKILVESHPCSRQWADQLAVTIPPAMEAPDRIWDYRRNHMNMSIYHNRRLDGKEQVHQTFTQYWESTVVHQWKEGRQMCDAFVLYNG